MAYFNVTTNLIGDGTSDPSGSVQVLSGESQGISIIPSADVEVSGMDNDIPITWTASPGTSTTSVALPADTYTKGSSTISGPTNLSNAVGNLAETTTLSPSNAYSGSGGTYSDFYYTFNTSSIPADAQNIKLTCVVKAKPESYSNTQERLKFQLAIGSTTIGTAYDFKDSGNNNLTIQTITSNTVVNYADLANLRLNGEIGYYGGGVAGITLTISYDLAALVYSYDINNVQEDHNIVVTIGNPLAIKLEDGWQTVKAVYKKTGGAWVEQPASNIRELFATRRYIQFQAPPGEVAVNLTQAGRWIDSGTTKDGCKVYKSDGSYNVDNAQDVARITVSGYYTLKLYIRSYAESNYDYTEAFEVNIAATKGSGKYTTKGKQSATDYIECIYALDPSVESFIDVMYSKDGSTSSNDDRGYFYYVVE